MFLPGGSEGLLPLVLNSVLESDVKVTPAKSALRVTHRRIGGREIYFVINDSAKEWSGEVAFAASGSGEQWDPGSGAMTEVKGNTVKLTLQPYGASLFRFAAAQLPERRAVKDGALPNLSLRPVQQVEPTEGHGEFVRAEIAADAANSKTNAPVWRAKARLTKTQVDTHLFVVFQYPKALDLSQAECVGIETWVPAGQKTPTQLLVVLHEEGGGDFIASTGRSLARPGA